MMLTPVQKRVAREILDHVAASGERYVYNRQFGAHAKTYGALVGAGLLKIVDGGIEAHKQTRRSKTRHVAWARYTVNRNFSV